MAKQSNQQHNHGLPQYQGMHYTPNATRQNDWQEREKREAEQAAARYNQQKWYEYQQARYDAAFPADPPAKPKKKRRVFLWVFLAVQVVFIAWLIGGAASMHGVPAQCAHYTGQTLKDCENASNVGGGIGLVLIFGLWVGVDFIMAVVYGIYRLAKR